MRGLDDTTATGASDGDRSRPPRPPAEEPPSARRDDDRQPPAAPRQGSSSANAPPASSTAPGRVEGLRSVRSEALVARAASAAKGGDDLKRIRGVGALLEKRLNMMGYTTYAQVAAWTADDIDRVSQQLDFRGRIERENWIEQARILAAGGQTDFSRRQDRGSSGDNDDDDGGNAS